MKFKNFVSAFLLFTTLTTFAQDYYSSLTISPELKKNANAVVRLNDVDVTLKSSSEMVISKKRIITVLNKQGDRNVDAIEYYDNNVKIKSLHALIYDAFGNEIKKIKKNNFKDVSAVDGGTLYSDSRVKYLDYTPINYPYTVEFTSVTITGNTAFIPSFTPIDAYFLSVENSSYSINFPESMTIRKKEKHIEGLDIVKEELPNKVEYKVKNLMAYKPESHSPSFFVFTPKVSFASKQFKYEGVSAEVENWKEFGKWVYQDLIKGAYDLTPSTIDKIRDLVKNEESEIEKAKKVYQYVQDKVRYISVQVGIGGWKPFNASDVDRLSYGDCKALTNYTMSLLKAVNVESYYTLLFAGNSQRNIDKEFASMQGNHAILSLPNDGNPIWLECTSQKTPFGFIGDFTDDRDVLVITPEGGEIKHTKKYTTEENTQVIKGTCYLSGDGEINVDVQVKSKGIQYDDKYTIEAKSRRDLGIYYKERWDYINNISITKINIINDKEHIEFNEDITFKASNYSSFSGDRMLLTVNVLNKNTYVPDRYRDRKLPLKIKRGFKDVDEVEIHLPNGFTVEALPESKTIDNKFGSYKMEIHIKDEKVILYKRTFIVNDGEFPKEDYAAFRSFYRTVSKQDNAKIALIKN